jgi:thiamine kinase-like enzyme
VRGRRDDGSDTEFVYKYFSDGDAWKEYAYLYLLAGLRVPGILARGNKALCLEYIKGDTLLERLERCERKRVPFSAYIDRLLIFLERFYAALPGHIYGDVNLRNFICAKNGLHGVDIEEARPGDICVDIGKAAAYILTSGQSATEYKHEAAAYLIESAAQRLGLDIEDIEKEKQKELNAIKAPRRRRARKA